MQCLSPVWVKVNKDDSKGIYQKRPCNKCYNCIQNRARDLVFRFEKERESNQNSYFVTLTYSEDLIFKDDFGFNDVDKDITKKVFKKWRNIIWCETLKKYPKPRYNSNNPLAPYYRVESQEIDKQRKFYYNNHPLIKFKYYLISEFGPETNRPHYHFLCFFEERVTYDYLMTHLKKIWSDIITIGDAEDARLNYMGQYVTKESAGKEFYNTKIFSRCSKNVGTSILDNTNLLFNILHTPGFLLNWRGHKMRLSQYYKRKLKVLGLISSPSQRAQEVIEYRKLIDNIEDDKKVIEQIGYEKYLEKVTKEISYNNYQKRIKQRIKKARKI